MINKHTNMVIRFLAHMRIMFFIFFFFFLGAYSAIAARPRNPLVDLSTPDELLRLAGYGEEKLSTVVVGGSLHCDHTFFNRNSISHPISGALMAVSCDTNKKRSKSNWVRGKTDEYGEFFIDLPSHLHAIPNMEKRCVVRALHLPKASPCHRRFTGKHTTGIKLTSSGNGVRTYSTDEIHLTRGPRRGRKMHG